MNTLSSNKINLPASKSISNRILVLEFLAQQDFSYKNLSDANDTQLMLKCLNKIRSTQGGIINCEDAGTVFRFLTSVLSITPGDWILTGTKRMQERPIDTLVDALKTIRASISYLNEEGFPPIQIQGKKLEGGSITISNSKSSQFVSSLMMIAPFITKGLTINVDLNNQDSLPYIQMTADVMHQLGIKVLFSNSSIIIPQSTVIFKDFFIENDWSSASYFYSIIALIPNLKLFLNGLYPNSIQGDSVVSKLFEQLGVNTLFMEEGILISNIGKTASFFEEDFRNYPDLAQTFAVCCTMLKVPAILSGLSSLRVKETDRLNALYTELNKIGASVIVQNNTLHIYPSDISIKEPVKTYSDHRMAMAFAPLELLYPDVIIEEKQVVKKSFLNYWEEFEKIKIIANKNNELQINVL